MHFSEVGAAIDGLGAGYQPAPRRHFHGGPDKRTRQEVIQELNLIKDVKVRLQTGEERIIRRIHNGEVYVYGLRDSVNVYGLTVVEA